MGVAGLAKRIRAKLKELKGEEPKPKKKCARIFGPFSASALLANDGQKM
jgi:hypothetical protein